MSLREFQVSFARKVDEPAEVLTYIISCLVSCKDITRQQMVSIITNGNIIDVFPQSILSLVCCYAHSMYGMSFTEISLIKHLVFHPSLCNVVGDLAAVVCKRSTQKSDYRDFSRILTEFDMFDYLYEPSPEDLTVAIERLEFLKKEEPDVFKVKSIMEFVLDTLNRELDPQLLLRVKRLPSSSDLESLIADVNQRLELLEDALTEEGDSLRDRTVKTNRANLKREIERRNLKEEDVITVNTESTYLEDIELYNPNEVVYIFEGNKVFRFIEPEYANGLTKNFYTNQDVSSDVLIATLILSSKLSAVNLPTGKPLDEIHEDLSRMKKLLESG